MGYPLRDNHKVDEKYIQSALTYCDADDRETWIRIGMALKSTLGDKGQTLWHRYSQQSSKYKERDAVIAWHSFSEYGQITIGTLFHYAKEGGWSPPHPNVPPVRRSFEKIQRERENTYFQRTKQEQEERWARASAEAKAVIAHAELFPSVYMRNKGLTKRAFTTHFNRTYSEHLKQQQQYEEHLDEGLHVPMKRAPYLPLEEIVVPMRDIISDEVMAVQIIQDKDGSKLFYPPGCRTSNTAFVINKSTRNRKTVWLCEGVATGYSIYLALMNLNRTSDSIVVCFSAHNMKTVAKSLQTHREQFEEIKDIFVCADHDSWKCNICGLKIDDTTERNYYVEKGSHTMDNPAKAFCAGTFTEPTGEKIAREIGLPWTMPAEKGDFNDMLQEHGVDDVADSLYALIDPDN